MKRTLLLVFSIMSSISFCQDVLMQNGSISTCSGIFYDSGGEFSNYSSNESFVLTICPEESEQRLKLDFLDFSTQLNADIMTIYDGNDTTASIIGEYSGNITPGLVFASFNNASGCLTIEYISNDAGNTTGWSADISCTNPCQEITAVLNSTTPTANTEAIIEVCVGDNINFNGSGIFEVDGTGASYTWDLGNGTTASGQSVNVSYDVPGVYLVNLDIRDTNMDNFMDGCPNINTINQIVRVSGKPDFSNTHIIDSTLCFGDTTTIEAVVNPLTLFYNCPPPESEETFLPDGNGAAYSTCINVTCFEADAVLTDVSQIFDICLNIEHSYSGDLDIKIISPNGQEAILFEQSGGGTYFGGANNLDNSEPGEGADYCFSMSASELLANANTINAGSNPPSNSWEPGTYLPVGSFDTLLGSPLNGEWCIVIVDNIPVDNGYIFSWELNFDDSVPQEIFEYVPTITSESWDANPSITEMNGNVITVAPTTAGEHCYTYRTVDEFGCEYTEDFCVTMLAIGESPTTFYEDLDGDGYGDANNSILDCSNIPPIGYALNGLDCDDLNNQINPDSNDSFGNGIDENCDGVDGNALSIEDLSINDIQVLPNPFKSVLNVNLPDVIIGNDINVKIYDLGGRSVFERVFLNATEDITINSLDKLEDAYYFLELSNDKIGFNVIKKIIKN
ncbi:PKD domain-containing protein [Winogradskyella flava]|uniref:Proprotein convertase P-domain-containing protein n=1 Tax=Winogradskyella flava TaxID=1884876 RepID=A0A842IYD7_9FLAO|nr:PKD domain-containing protein [Winogradskyella flava]MBC2846683.1 proprotein convertase P-domain-containing protein [Winogradskyella flava]